MAKLLAPPIALASLVLLGSTCVAFWGGMLGFRAMMMHGIAGPFAGVALHGGRLSVADLLVGVLLAGSMGVNLRYRTTWTLALGLLSAGLWPAIGWGSAV